MSDPVTLSLLSVILVSVVSFAGVLTLVLKDVTIRKFLLYFVAFSAGALFGDAFIHLLPEVTADGFTTNISLYILSGVIVSFLVEKGVHWRHCHIPSSKKHPHTFAYMNLFGDAVHNFIDGLIIAASYMVSVPIGIATTIAVVFHEIPQEIGDFGVLLHGGFSKNKALMLNFLTAATAIAGALIALAVSAQIEGSIVFLASFAAGGFIYIAGADLIPELHKRFTIKSSIGQIIALLLGMGVMYLLIFLE
ncbi:MAG: zinc/iron permease [archaeon GW2011_AR5]|nr:MAG: zinc/iron permease [archaeon GW2011_AR5]